MLKNESRLTAKELELKKEALELVALLNNKIRELKEHGVMASVSSSIYNDGQEDWYIKVHLSCKIDC